MKKIKLLVGLLIFINSIILVKNITYASEVKEDFIVNIEYEENNENNTVIVHAKSNRELIQKTLSGWTLGEDKMSYTAVYNKNQEFYTNFTDTLGNKIQKHIKINGVDETGPEVKVTYKYNEKDNTETVYVTSNEKMKVKTLQGWKLSEDKMSYTATYETNQVFYTNFTDVWGNKTSTQIVIDKINTTGKPDIEITYEFLKESNKVKVHAKSDRKLQQKTLSGWVLGEDRMSYTAIYDRNQTFYTNFTDLFGNKTSKQIIIQGIDEEGPKVKANYKYNEDRNTVTVYVTSNEKMKVKTLSGWTLSEDKMSYTAEYSVNQTFYTNFTDIWGNKTSLFIEIQGIDDKGPEVKANYKYNEDRNTVTVTVTSDEEMIPKTLSGWKLSEDKMSYTAEYAVNQTFYTNFTDIWRNKTSLLIMIHEIDDKGPELKIEYIFNKNMTECKVIVTANEEMKVKTLPGWTLSEDKKVYTAIYNTNQNFVTNFTDIWGNVTKQEIKISFNTGIDVSKHNGKIDWEKVKKSGITFVMIRCGFGKDAEEQDDPYFQYNISECERLGIKYGIYLYSYALTEDSAYSEVNHALRLIKNYNPKLGVWIDMEDADGYKKKNGMPTNQVLVNICDIFCSALIGNGYSSGIYASLSWLNNQLNSSKLDKYNKWVAQWNSSCSYNKPYKIWQYTSNGQVDGINGNVDMDILYD